MRADELMQKMWNEDLVGIADQNKRLTAEEVLAARKEAQSRRYAEGYWSEVVIPWKDDDTPLFSNRKATEDRLISWETPSAKAWRLLRNTARDDRSQGMKEWIQGLHKDYIQLVPTSFSCSEISQRDY